MGLRIVLLLIFSLCGFSAQAQNVKSTIQVQIANSSAAGLAGGTILNNIVNSYLDLNGQTSFTCPANQFFIGFSNLSTPICAPVTSATIPCSGLPALTGDVTTSAGSCATVIGATKVTSSMLNSNVFSTAHNWPGQQTFVAPILGVATGTSLGLTGATSGTANITPQAIAGTPTLTLPNTSGTLADSASSPLVLSATTGNLTCTSCVTSSGGGAITGTAPIAVSAAGVVSITGSAGQVLAGASPAFTATPTLGASGTLGSLAFGNATSGTVTLQTVTGALGSVTASLPANTGTIAELNLAQTFTAAQQISSNSATAFDVGPNGSTNPAFQIDASASSLVAGLKLVGVATAGTVQLLTTDTGASTNLDIEAKGAGVITLAATSSGGVAINHLLNMSAATAGQIQFPSSQNASANANTLDDYTEGTFVPVLAFGGASVGITYGTQLGKYTKIGNVVHYVIAITLTAVGSSTGVASISGLPVTAATGADYACSMLVSSMNAAVTTTVQAQVGNNSTTITPTKYSAGTNTVLQNTDFTATSTVRLSGIYFTN